MKDLKVKVWSNKGNYFLNIQEDPDYTCNFGSKGELLLVNNGTPQKGMDYTFLVAAGAKDKNGVDIYEGDIVSFHAFVNGGGMAGFMEADYLGKGKIVYRPDEMLFVIADKERDWIIADTSHNEEPCIEVIGNIYEDPELLG